MEHSDNSDEINLFCQGIAATTSTVYHILYPT